MAIAEPDPPAGAPDWIVTFADMISLLVTFFILLMTFSSLESFDAFTVQGNNTGTPGVITSDGASSSQPPPKVDFMAAKDVTRGAQLPHSRPSEELLADVSNKGAKATDEHTELNLGVLNDGLHIQFDERAAFKPGSVELTDYLLTSIRELAGTLEHYPYTVVFEGHTDNAVKATREYPNEGALATARAEAVAQAALASSRMSPLQIQIAGYGSSRPLVSNQTAEGRRTNRRVEIRIMSLSKQREAALARSKRSDG